MMIDKIFELTFENAAVGMAHLDAEGKWIRVNQYLCNFLGYTQKELFNITFKDITHKDDLHFDLSHAEKLYMGESDSFNIEKRYIRKDGSPIWAQLSASCIRDNKGKIEYFISVITDINDRKKLEFQNRETLFALEQSNQKYKELNQNLKKAESLAKLGHWSLDLTDNTLTWSDEIFTIFEIDQNSFEATYEAFINTIHPDDRDMVTQAYNLSLETKEKYQIVHRLLLQDNRIKYVLEQCETQFDEHEKPVLSIGTVQDITQRVEEEKFFKMHTRQAQMGEMISMIAHQWRQPLAIINAIASQIRIKEMLKEEEDLTLIESLRKIEQQSLHLSQTISDYRDFFRPDKPIETVSLSDLIEHTLELIDHALKSHGISIQPKIKQAVYAHLYKNEVIQVLISLFKNSFDAFEENSITDRVIRIEISQEDKYGVIEITDNGGGISKEVLNKIFVPYFTTKNHSYGTGLGLYMSKMIIEENCHGVLMINSENDETTVRIKLPTT